MSAIFGRVELRARPLERGTFVGAFNTLVDYGPDRSDTWLGESSAVGRHLLRISPAARHEGPPEMVDGQVVVADAVLDNRQELARQLGVSKRQLDEASDTDLIGWSFASWGTACIQRLVGDYAFAVLRPDRRELFLFRDHIGTRPLYWSKRDDTLLFSSAVDAIVRDAQWRWQINDRVVAEHLLCPPNAVSGSFFNDVRVVPPGSYVHILNGEARTEAWWKPARQVLKNATTQEVVATCRHLLEQAISDRIDTTGGVGSHLSGGIDSSSITILAARMLRQHGRSLTRAYAWAPPVSDAYPLVRSDERRRILAIASAESFSIQFGAADGANLIDFAQRPIESQGEADLADEIPTLKAAHRDGVRVLLSGWGGDEAFSTPGRGHIARLALTGNLVEAMLYARGSGWSLRRPRQYLSMLFHHIGPRVTPGWFRRRQFWSLLANKAFISRDLLRQHSDLLATRELLLAPIADPRRDVYATYLPMRMQSWAAWASTYGFQYRFPLLDRRLLEFLVSLPQEHLLMDRRPRGLARAVLADTIPSTLTKADPANELMRRNARYAAWKSIAQKVAANEFSEDCPWLDMVAFRRSGMNPLEQDNVRNAFAFVEVFAALRTWHLHRRARQNGWI